MVVYGNRQHALGVILSDHVVVEEAQSSVGVGTPSRDFTSELLFSSRMMSMQSSTHSSQMNTVGPAMSLRTSCWDLPQNEQYKVFFESPDLLVSTPAPDVREPAWKSNPRRPGRTRTIATPRRSFYVQPGKSHQSGW